MSDYILEVKKLSKTYSETTVLHQVNFSLLAGEVHALVGENGAGKSTLVKIIAGVEKPDNGSEIYINGKPVKNMTPTKSLEEGICVIYQDIGLFPNLSVMENISIGKKRGGLVTYKGMEMLAKDVLAQMGIEIDLKEIFGDLPVAKKQLVAIGRALAFEARIIIMDEPTASLSADEVQKLYDIVDILRKNGVSVIYISHKFEEIFYMADRITVLRDGYHVATKSVSDYNQNSLVKAMIGRELLFEPMHHEGEVGEVLFEVKDLTLETSFRNISFRVMEKEILGITGLVGAGRSEVAQAIFGINKPEKGEIFYKGQKLNIRSSNDAIHQGICYLPEDRGTQGLFLGQKLYINVTASNLKNSIGKFLISIKKELSITEDYIDRVNIKPQNSFLDINNFSGGNQQKALIGRWLNANPRVLIVDEPTSGIDLGSKAEIHELLRKLAEEGIAVILISSDMSEVLALSDRIIVMNQGEIAGEYLASEATQENLLTSGITNKEV